jgi:hypothetical protein
MSRSAWLRRSSFSSGSSLVYSSRGQPQYLWSWRTIPGSISSSVGPPTTGSPLAMSSAVSRTIPSRSRWASRFSLSPG